MPVEYRIDDELRLVHTVWKGAAPLSDWLEYLRELAADPRFAPDMLELSDARHASVSMDHAGVRRVALESVWGPGCRRAVVAPDDDTFAVCRMYEAQLRDGGEVRIFREWDSAVAWLGLSPGDVAEPTDTAPPPSLAKPGS